MSHRPSSAIPSDFAAFALLLTALGLAACGAGTDAGGKLARDLSFPVELQTVTAESITFSIAAVGSVEAFEIVAVTARVGGAVEKMAFAEGDQVTPDQILVEIEPERFRLAEVTARAALAKAEAAKADADAALARREAANKANPGLVRDEDLTAARTRTATAVADVDQAKAALALAELNVHDALVRAPLAGVIQTRSIATGKYVQPGTVLATLVRRDPLLLRFSVPETDATRLAIGQQVSFTVAGETKPFVATINHITVAADPASRLVEVVAKVDDPEQARLRPGAFAQVTVPVGAAKPVLVVPQTAVRPSERGFLAYVVVNEGGNEIAHERKLTLGMRTPSGMVEARDGLAPGDRLVVRGGEALREGAEVKVSGAKGRPTDDAVPDPGAKAANPTPGADGKGKSAP
jgi:multidrug efflux system membrane fusion protein